jgi:hypothetical protein
MVLAMAARLRSRSCSLKPSGAAAMSVPWSDGCVDSTGVTDPTQTSPQGSVCFYTSIFNEPFNRINAWLCSWDTRDSVTASALPISFMVSSS